LNDKANSPLNARNDTPALPASQEANEAPTLLPMILPPRTTCGNDFAAACHAVERDEAGIDLHDNLADYGELEIAKAPARHSVKIVFPKHSVPDNVVPKGKYCASLESRPEKSQGRKLS